MAKKKRKAKKVSRKPTRGAKKSTRKARPSPTPNTAKRGQAKARGKTNKTKKNKAPKAPAKAASRKKAAAPARKRASKPTVSRFEPASSGGLTPFPPAGEVYGEEGWKEEELSAAELDTDAPELDEIESELGPPEVGEESDDSEW